MVLATGFIEAIFDGGFEADLEAGFVGVGEMEVFLFDEEGVGVEAFALLLIMAAAKVAKEEVDFGRTRERDRERVRPAGPISEASSRDASFWSAVASISVL